MVVPMSALPMTFVPGCRSKEVSLAARASNALFGAPNARRANGIVSTAFDLGGLARRIAARLFGRPDPTPVFAIDRRGTEFRERLPRIWLSEQVANTSRDGGRRVFVESYPSAPDRGGARALELGDRYLGEGLHPKGGLEGRGRVECFKAAEILYLHAVRRGNREAAARLRRIYRDDLCEGDYWKTRLEERARHARPASALARLTGAPERRGLPGPGAYRP